MIEVPAAPDGAKDAGTRLWRAVLGKYELQEFELILLVQACRVADLCADLQAHIDRDGPMVSGRRGAARMRPAVAELRQQRLTLARLMVALRVPIGDQEEDPAKSGTPRLQRRGGARGFYAIAGGRDA